MAPCPPAGDNVPASPPPDTKGLYLQSLGRCWQQALMASILSPPSHSYYRLVSAQQHLFLLDYGGILFFLHTLAATSATARPYPTLSMLSTLCPFFPPCHCHTG